MNQQKKKKYSYKTGSERMNRQLVGNASHVEIQDIISPWPSIEQLKEDGVNLKKLSWHNTTKLYSELKELGYFK